MDRKKFWTIGLIILAVSFAIAFVVYQFLPDTIPLQFGIDGKVDRTGSRSMVFVFALLPAIIYFRTASKRAS